LVDYAGTRTGAHDSNVVTTVDELNRKRLDLGERHARRPWRDRLGVIRARHPERGQLAADSGPTGTPPAGTAYLTAGRLQFQGRAFLLDPS